MFFKFRPSVFQRFLDVISFGRNKTEDRFLLSDYSLQDRHYSLFDEPSDDVFDSEFEHLETIIHPNSSGPSKKGPNEKTRIFENPLASASVNNCRQPNGVTKFNAILPPSSNYQSCDDVTFGDDLESDRQSEPEMQWDEDLNGVTHDYPFSVDDNSSGRLTNDAENFATPLRLIDNGNQTVLMSNGTRIDAIQCSPKPIEREAASFYFLASDGSENNGNSNL